MVFSKRGQQDLSATLFGLLDILLTLHVSDVGYIDLISPVKSGQFYENKIMRIKSGCKNSNITYFDMIIKTPDVNYRGILSSKYLREALLKMEENHFPIKIKCIIKIKL